MRALVLLALLAASAAAQTPAAMRRALDHALAPIQKSAATFVQKRACVSCHHNILPLLLFPEAQSRGVAVDPGVWNALRSKTFRAIEGPNAFDDAVQAVGLNDPTPNDSFLLLAANASFLRPTRSTAVLARRLARWQREDGHWITSDFRPPHSSSYFTATASAIRAIAAYGTPEDRSGFASARQWLVQSKPASVEDAAFRLMGLVWASAPARDIEAARRDLLALQRSSGGWPQLPRYVDDAYSTGEALYALSVAGTPITAPAFRSGLRFLLSTQAADGTWRIHTRMLSPAEVSPEYFPTGFPYRKDEYISYAGTVWAAMALVRALPDAGGIDASGLFAPAAASIEDTFFDTAEQLQKKLDGGLSPDSRTARGTTLLMMSVTDPAKVRLLLARGADPNVRAASGVDALTVAASMRGTAETVRLLVQAGVPPNPPEGTHPKNTPLLMAAMTGDVEVMRLLLACGAEPSVSALSQVVTFGYPDAVQMLIDAGAHAKVTESSGINMLHWAAIADRPQVIPVLAGAGIDINAQDEHGFTPLMYAATIDFGDTRVAEALLHAGADPSILNDAGRNAIEQARHFGHGNLEAVLRQFRH